MTVAALRGATVCSGIGAPEVAAPWVDWHWCSEIEPFPSEVHRIRHGVPNRGDMTRFEEWPDDAVDLLVGGTPCQSFSVAGLRAGLADPRGNLALTYLALADRYRPRWLVWENVPGVLSSNGGRDFGAFLGGLGQLGYGFAYRVLDAQFTRTREFPWAVPQRRRRVFVVGCLGGWAGAAAVLFDAQSLRGDSAPRREAGQGTARGAQDGAGGGGVLAHDVAATLNAAFGSKQGLEDQHVNQGCPHFIAFDTTQITSASNYSVPKAGGPCHPLAAGAHPPAIAFGAQNSIAQGDDVNVEFTAALTTTRTLGVRRLTPRECERLQGFPDDFTAIPWRGKPAELCPDGPRYKALGNSMAVNVMGWLLGRIRDVDARASVRSAA